MPLYPGPEGRFAQRGRLLLQGHYGQHYGKPALPQVGWGQQKIDLREVHREILVLRHSLMGVPYSVFWSLQRYMSVTAHIYRKSGWSYIERTYLLMANGLKVLAHVHAQIPQEILPSILFR